MFLTFLGPPTSLMIYSTLNHQKLPFSDPTHLFDDVILEWSLIENLGCLIKDVFCWPLSHSMARTGVRLRLTQALHILPAKHKISSKRPLYSLCMTPPSDETVKFKGGHRKQITPYIIIAIDVLILGNLEKSFFGSKEAAGSNLRIWVWNCTHRSHWSDFLAVLQYKLRVNCLALEFGVLLWT